MQLELWARRRDTLKFERLDIFKEVKSSYSKLGSLDSSIYSEGIILRTDIGMQPACVLFKELEKPKIRSL